LDFLDWAFLKSLHSSYANGRNANAIHTLLSPRARDMLETLLALHMRAKVTLFLAAAKYGTRAARSCSKLIIRNLVIAIMRFTSDCGH
jgi:hypothetical protein